MLEVDVESTVGALDLAIRLEVPAGETLAIVGPSGSGKTSILRAIAGLYAPRLGRISSDGEAWFDRRGRVAVPPELRRCGYVFQDYALFDQMRVWQNVAYGVRGRSRSGRRRIADEWLERLDIGPLGSRRPRTLSGGERQRVALARALAPDPTVVLLDEPLSALDAQTRRRSIRELRAALEVSGAASVLVTHDFEEAAVLAGRVAVLKQGRIVQIGTASELAASPESAFVADMTGANVLTGTARPGPSGLTEVVLDSGPAVLSVENRSGRVGVGVHPWEITLESPGAAAGTDSAQNRLRVEVTSVTVVGNRARVGLDAGQALIAEVTRDSAERLKLRPGATLTAVWKASSTSLVEL